MSDDLKKLQETMTAVQGHMQDLQGEQRATTHELKKLEASTSAGLKALEARSVHIEASMAALGGTFASIERLLEKVLSDQEDLQTKYNDIVRRLEALEKKAS